MGYDFKGVNKPENKTFLKPGIYDLTVSKAEYLKPAEIGKNGQVKVTFEGDSGSMTHSFWITPKTMDRLVYVHEEMFGKPLEKAFENADQVGAYFEKAFNAVKPTKRILVSGKEGTDGKIYADLGYANFVANSEAVMGEFEEGSTQWKNNVKFNKDKAMLSTSATRLGGDTPTGTMTPDDLPF